MKKFFTILGVPVFTLVGGVIGFILGIVAINFIPDKCITQGITATCQNPFEFMGLVGWIGTSFLGLIIGALIGLASYFVFTRRKT